MDHQVSCPPEIRTTPISGQAPRCLPGCATPWLFGGPLPESLPHRARMKKEMTTDWIARQNQTAQGLLQQGSEALRKNDLNLAQAALMESAIVLDMAAEFTVDVKKLRAQAFNELGVVHQRQGDMEGAFNFHKEAANLCDTLVNDHELQEFRGNSAATHLNFTSICLAAGHTEEAREAIATAQSLVDELYDEGEETIVHMATAVFMTKSTFHASVEEYEEADEAMERSLELGEEAVEADNAAMLGQMTQGCQQLSVMLFQNEQYDRALKWGRNAEELAERAFEKLGQEVVPVYVVSQINLISYNEKLGHYAEAEDSLWKALELVGNDPRLLRRGRDFYEACRKLADSKLEAGNLPREEVNAGRQEVLDRIEEIGGLPAEEPDDDDSKGK